MARKTIRTFALAGSLLLGLAGSALTASVASAEGEGACPELTQVKYPFIQCTANEYGGVTLSMPDAAPLLACHLRLPNGDCAASPAEWQLDTPVIGPGPM